MPARYSNLKVREGIERTVKVNEEIINDPVSFREVKNKDQFKKKTDDMRHQLEAITPPDTSVTEKKKIYTRLKKLEEAMINGNEYVPPMPSQGRMEKTPVGAVDQNIAWESFWKKHTLDDEGNVIKIDPRNGGRGGVYEWKDLRRILLKDQEAESPNAANIDIIRPVKDDIPLADLHSRSYGFSPALKDKYDEIFPDHERTDVEKKLEEASKGQVEAQPVRVEPAKEPARHKKTCAGVRSNGSKCNGPVMFGGEFCRHHNKLRRQEKLAQTVQLDAQSV